jgi:hypothetical protein
MARFKKLVWSVTLLVLLTSLLGSLPLTVSADSGVEDRGSFDIFVFTNGDWQCQGKFSFRDYETRELALTHDAGLVRLKLVQQGHDAAFVDYVALYKDGVAYQPVSAINNNSNANYLTKVLSPEFDVCDAWNSSLEIVWNNVPADSSFVMRAVEEDLGKDHGGPLYHPRIHLGNTLSLTLVNDGSITIDGRLAETEEPDFSVFWTPSSPHPDGYTYGWLQADDHYLYAAVEVTADNTCDTADWGALYVMVNGELQEFRVSAIENQWGVAGFQYTSTVPYEHRVYEFKIPLNEINAGIGDEIQYGIGCYGTLAISYTIEFITNPANTGNVVFDGTQKFDGQTKITHAGNYSITANIGPGYGFYRWQVEGGISVGNPAKAVTTCHVDGDGILRMVQLPLPELLWVKSMLGDVTDIAVGDLNGDNQDDVAALDNLAGKTLVVLNGEGDGSGNPALLSPGWTKAISGYSVAVGDINGDFVNEVIAASNNGIVNSLFAYQNDGTFLWQYDTTGIVKDIEIGDIDNNGINDVIACNNTSAPGTIYAIDGITHLDLEGWPKIYGDEEFMDIAVGQLDGEGGLDVAAIGRALIPNVPPSTLYVLDSTGDELWHQHIDGRTVEIGDVDGDRKKEVVAGADDGYVYAYSGKYGTELHRFNAGSPVTDVELGDLDGHPSNGLEVACIDNGQVGALYALDIDNSPGSQVMWHYDMAWDSQFYGESLAIGDVDRDYKNEVVACSSITVHRVYAFDGLDNNSDGIGDLVWSPYEVYSSITDLEIGDLDGDGDQDVVFGTDPPSGGSVYAIAAVESTTITATNTGTAYFDSDPSTLENLAAVSEGTLPPDGKPDYRYPHGFFNFNITGLIPGQTAIVTVTLPSDAPIGTKWVKYENSQWSILPIGDYDGDNVITFELTDSDRDGSISDPGAPAYPLHNNVIGVGGKVEPVNKLGVIFPVLAMALVIILSGVLVGLVRRKGI